MLNQCTKYISGLSGAIMVAFALMGPFVVGAAGMALDFSHAYLVQQRLAHAIDAAALAAAASSTDPDVIEAKIREFFETNYPPEKLGATFDPEVTVTDSEIQVAGHAQYFTFFLTLIGIDDINVDADTTVHRDVRGLEVALVLDNTGSMSDGNKITALRTAATNFVDILFSHTNDPEAVKIGLVPYASGVRVGKYGLGKNPDGTTYRDGTVFVTLPNDVVYTSNHNAGSGWYGCVVEHNDNNYSTSATYVASSKGQLWKNGSSWNGHGWNPASTLNDPYPSDVTDDWEGPWDIYQYGSLVNTCTQYKCKTYWPAGAPHFGSCKTYYTSGSSNCQTWSYSFSASSQPNQNCPYTNVLPLTSDQDTLHTQINTMTAHGNTLGNVGAIWGYRMLSPDEPFTEGVDWDNEYWHKAVLIMTDGINTRDGTYSNFWFASKNNLGVSDYDERLLEVCDLLKDKGVAVYTIILGTGGRYPEPDQATKDIYKACATTEDQYYDAPSNEELIGVFEEISRELSNIYIAH